MALLISLAPPFLHAMEKGVFSTVGAGKGGYPHAKNKVEPSPHITYDKQLKMDQTSRCKA